MFSNIDIINAIKKGELIIKPFDKKLLKPCAYTFRLDNEFAIAVDGEIDPLKTRKFDRFYRKVRVKKNGTFTLKPGQFVLGRTKEKVSVPKSIGLFIDGTTTFARFGVSIIQTAMLVHAGHGVPKARKIILEITNAGPFNVILTPGMQIADGVFFELKTPTDRPYDAIGKYGLRKRKDELLPLRQ